MTRNRSLSPDSKGRYRPRVGWTMENGGRVQPRFNLGTDKREAEFRLHAIRRVYDENVKAAGEDVWSPLGLSLAREIERGTKVVQISSPDPRVYNPKEEYAQLVEMHGQTFPSLTFLPTDETAYQESREFQPAIVAQRIRDLEAELRQLGALVGSDPRLQSKLIAGTFHEALAEYKNHIELTGERDEGELTQNHRNRMKRADLLLRHHKDFPLMVLNLTKCEQLIVYWRSRPKMKRGQAASSDTIRHQIAELFRFFGWLEDTKGWERPKGLQRVNRKPPRKAPSLLGKEVYTPKELGILLANANELDRLLICLAINCGMGASEAGGLGVEGDVLFNHQHEYADRLHFKSTARDSFIRYLRPKTFVFGEWYLWPETTKLLRWGIGRARSLGSPLIICRESGAPLYDRKTANPQAAIAKRFSDLYDRVKKRHKEFRWLPFGSLRDVMSDTLAHKYDGELSSLVIAHGSPYKNDDLLECYANKPFGRLHTALKELRSHFAPMFSE